MVGWAWECDGHTDALIGIVVIVLERERKISESHVLHLEEYVTTRAITHV